MNGAVGMANFTVDSHHNLATDNDDENDVVVLTEPNETIDVELLNGKLEFKVCSPGCMGQYVSVCYVAANGKYNKFAKGECGKNGQCEFRAGVRRVNDENNFWLMVETTFKDYYDHICGQAVMKFPSTKVDVLGTGIYSCEPLKHDTKVVTLYVHKASANCPLKVIGAKRWYPPTSTTPEASNVTAPTSLSVSSEASTSDDNMALWIALGIVGGIVVLAVLFGCGYCMYQIRKQKKAAATAKQIQPIPPKATDAPPAPTPIPVMKEEPAKEVTKEPSKAEPEKPKKVKAEPKKEGNKKETAADKAYVPMPFLGKKETEHDEKIQRLHDKYKREIEQHQKTIQQLRKKAAPGQLPNFDAEKDATIIDLTRKYGDLIQTAEETQKKFDKIESTFKTQLAERDHEIADLHDQLQNFENDGKRFKEEFSRLKMVSVKAENNMQELAPELEPKRTELDTVTKSKVEKLKHLQVEVVELQSKLDEEKQKNASEYQKWFTDGEEMEKEAQQAILQSIQFNNVAVILEDDIKEMNDLISENAALKLQIAVLQRKFKEMEESLDETVAFVKSLD